MMHDRRQSDSSTVPGKPSNKAEGPAAEVVEEGADQGQLAPSVPRPGLQSRTRALSALERVRQAARRRDRQQRFTALLCTTWRPSSDCVDAYLALQRDAAPGVDGETWRPLRGGAGGNLQHLARPASRGERIEAKPVRRAYIPKADGRQQTARGSPRWKIKWSSAPSWRC